MRFPVLVFAFLAVVLSGPLFALAGARPDPTSVLLVVVSPAGPGAVDVIRAAGGVPIGPNRAPLASLAAPAAPDFALRLRDAGAWLVLDGQRLAAICGVSA